MFKEIWNEQFYLQNSAGLVYWEYWREIADKNGIMPETLPL